MLLSALGRDRLLINPYEQNGKRVFDNDRVKLVDENGKAKRIDDVGDDERPDIEIQAR